MAALDRLKGALVAGKKTRGKRTPYYRPDGSLDHYSREHIEVLAGDVAEVCAACTNQDDEIVQAQTKGTSRLPGDTRVILYADDVFHLCDLAEAKPAAA
jgi:hypothetical protein